MSETSDRLVTCPTCGRGIPWSPHNKYRPFCCERCKLIDLGHWAAERYRVKGETAEEQPKESSNNRRPLD